MCNDGVAGCCVEHTMDERELRHRIERSQQELDYWRERADQMRSVLDRLETDYLTHRTDCCLVRQRRLRVVIAQAQAAVASLENAGADWLQPESSTTSSGRSSPTESDALLTQPHHSSIVSAAADYSRNVRRAAFLSQLKCKLRAFNDCLFTDIRIFRSVVYSSTVLLFS